MKERIGKCHLFADISYNWHVFQHLGEFQEAVSDSCSESALSRQCQEGQSYWGSWKGHQWFWVCVTSYSPTCCLTAFSSRKAPFNKDGSDSGGDTDKVIMQVCLLYPMCRLLTLKILEPLPGPKLRSRRNSFLKWWFLCMSLMISNLLSFILIFSFNTEKRKCPRCWWRTPLQMLMRKRSLCGSWLFFFLLGI